jgi:hypothetical protein
MDDQGHIEHQTPDIADLTLPSISKSCRRPPQKRDYMVNWRPCCELFIDCHFSLKGIHEIVNTTSTRSSKP